MALLGAASITGVPAFGLPKISSFRFYAVVDQREQGNSPRLQKSLELLDRFVHRVIAGCIDHSCVSIGRHRVFLQAPASAEFWNGEL